MIAIATCGIYLEDRIRRKTKTLQVPKEQDVAGPSSIGAEERT